MLAALESTLATAPNLSSRFEALPVGDALLTPELGTSGVIGDPFAADPELGREALDQIASVLADWLDLQTSSMAR